MARTERPDYPGSLHHVMSRGAEGHPIFSAEADCLDLLSRIDSAAGAHGVVAYAWVLMPNHFHLLLGSGRGELAVFLRRVLTGFSVSYNRQHLHKGHVFMRRYKSILVERELYFLELIRYIHLNPLRAGLLSSLEELAAYRWSGHADLLCRIQRSWYDVEGALSAFGDDRHSALGNYLGFLREGTSAAPDPVLSTGNYMVGRKGVVPADRDVVDSFRYDYRGAVLGSLEFATRLAGKLRVQSGLTRDRRDEHVRMSTIAQAIADENGIPLSQATGGGKRPASCRVRRLVVHVLSRGGICHADIARFVGIAPGSVWSILNSSQLIPEEEDAVGRHLDRFLSTRVGFARPEEDQESPTGS